MPFACGYYLSYVYRNVNATLFRDLVAELGLDASALGLLTSAYFFTFAAAQLPVGLLLDRYGPRRVNAALFALAAAGAAGFALSHSVTGLVVSRALIGLGVSAGLMAAMKAFVEWFPLSRLARLNGTLMAVGGLGAMTATAPVEAVLGLIGWRGLFALLSALTLAVGAAILWIAPERGAGTRAVTADLLTGLRRVLRDGFFWRVTAVSATTLGPAIALQGLWAGPWLRDVAGLDKQGSAHVLFVLTIALTAGFLLSGRIADLARRCGARMIEVLAAAGLLSALALAGIAVAAGPGATALWFVYIFVTAGATLAYPVLVGHFPGALTGRVNASLNMATFVAAFAAQYGTGPVLDRWGTGAAGPGAYPPVAYGIAFGAIALLQGAALCWLLPVLVDLRRRGRPV